MSVQTRSDTAPGDFADSPLSRVLPQPMLLGLFLPIQTRGWSPSLLPRSARHGRSITTSRCPCGPGHSASTLSSQWLGKGGHGGQQHYCELSLDPFIALSALSAVTTRILLISTIRVLYGPWHPLHLAKFGARLDYISGGRWGINLVTGNALNEPAHDRAGAVLPVVAVVSVTGVLAKQVLAGPATVISAGAELCRAGELPAAVGGSTRCC